MLDEYQAWPGRKFKETVRVQEVSLAGEAAHAEPPGMLWATYGNPEQTAATLKWTQELAYFYRTSHVAVALAEICSEQYFQGHSMLLEFVAAPLRGFADAIQKAIARSNKFFVFELWPGSPIDLSEPKQSARKEASGELKILAEEAKIFTLERLGQFDEARARSIQLRNDFMSKAAECAVGYCQHQPAPDGWKTHSD